MEIEQIEQAFEIILYNTQTIQKQLKTDFFDALIEHNVGYAAYLRGEVADDLMREASTGFKELQQLNLSAEALRKVFQLVIIKGYQETQLQANHALTPDSIGFIFAYLLENLTNQTALKVVDFGSGTGNLAQTLEFGVKSGKIKNLLGLEIDDLLIDLSASIADLTESQLRLEQLDATRYHEGADIIISDLPIGFYPDDAISAEFLTATNQGKTYAHHLLIENAMRNLRAGGFGIFLAPLTLFDSQQSDLLAKWLQKTSYLQMVINLPEKFFKGDTVQKAIYVFEKPSSDNQQREVFVYHLTDLKDRAILASFITKFNEWYQK
ncbi:MAG: class I SAM-dependent methyltransferase [Streptococcaceae bacterium]|jgi:site-specific DNA-methyltransferase (adenine-specific)|nr:class I SAM-dependent methyltransferase [Streptococcaceae bacterium]